MKIGTNKKCKIVACFTGESKERKTPYYGLEFENQEGECIEGIFYLTEKTKQRNIQLLANLGFAGKSLADLSNPKFSIDDLFLPIQDDINIVVENEEYTSYEGELKKKQVVKFVNVGERFGKADHTEALRIFKSSIFDGMLAQIKSSEKNNNDEIPF